MLAAQRCPVIGAGDWHMCVLSTPGQTWCWGSNEHGHLGAASAERGMGTTLDCSSAPLQVSGNPHFAGIIVGDLVSCGQSTVGEAWCRGMDLGGQLGDVMHTSSALPVAVAGGQAFTALTSGIHAGLI